MKLNLIILLAALFVVLIVSIAIMSSTPPTKEEVVQIAKNFYKEKYGYFLKENVTNVTEVDIGYLNVDLFGIKTIIIPYSSLKSFWYVCPIKSTYASGELKLAECFNSPILEKVPNSFEELPNTTRSTLINDKFLRYYIFNILNYTTFSQAVSIWENVAKSMAQARYDLRKDKTYIVEWRFALTGKGCQRSSAVIFIKGRTPFLLKEDTICLD